MFRLPRSTLSGILLSSYTASSISSLHRCLLSATVAGSRISPSPSFAVEEYLVDTCGLTRPQALKASAKISHIKSPTNPDAVLAFLAGLGFSGADVSALIAKDPKFLCASVGRTLSPIFEELTGLGLSRSEVVRLVLLTAGGGRFRRTFVVSRVHYYLSLFGSSENLLRALKGRFCFLDSDLERRVKPTVTLLQECRLGACDIAKLLIAVPRMLTTNTEHIRVMVACAEGIGVPRGSGMFRAALHAVAFQSEEEVAAKVEYLRNTFSWSHAEVGIAVSKFPHLLRYSKDRLQCMSEFFISEAGLEPAYIAQQPVMLGYSLEGRLRPRYYVIKFLKENGLLKRVPKCSTIFHYVEKLFVDRHIHPHKEAAPHLAEDYAAACRGEMQTCFRFMNQERSI
ncbi:transcription termination factor MTERF5, chloroplastic [Triticum aestivum]|uniref:transcription termination factor MTERF5, chloroplastic n=1 Tax=Triticum aestivum TaxID=4565 RepID=UPI001D0255FA|nr:transcription termination factor MTERF5, chloroplastic-like [Triticum aestivum]